MAKFLLNDEERLWADEGIARVEAAIMRSVAAGMEPQEAIRRHLDAMWEEFPHATVAMAFRAIELGLDATGGRPL